MSMKGRHDLKGEGTFTTTGISPKSGEFTKQRKVDGISGKREKPGKKRTAFRESQLKRPKACGTFRSRKDQSRGRRFLKGNPHMAQGDFSCRKEQSPDSAKESHKARLRVNKSFSNPVAGKNKTGQRRKKLCGNPI